jgi:hypothetical protein
MKKTLKTIIKDFAEGKIYFSLNQIRKFLFSKGLKYSDVSIKKYIKQLINENYSYNAGRGYYSKIKNEFKPDNKSLKPIVKLLKQKSPFLEFSVWGTEQIKFAFHHLQNKFYTFIFSEADSLEILRDRLASKGYSVYLNPTINDVKKNPFTEQNSIILRNRINHKLSKEQFAPIEKILVDLYIEAEWIGIIDLEEYSRVFEYFLRNYRLNISLLLDYAERRKILTIIKEYLRKYINPTFV